MQEKPVKSDYDSKMISRDIADIKSEYPLLFMEKDYSARYDLAWQKARQAAEILKKHYMAENVFVFGSLLHREIFDLNSDIDLAVSGIPDNRFYHALGTLMQILAPFEVDLVDINDCRKSIRKTIESEGMEL